MRNPMMAILGCVFLVRAEWTRLPDLPADSGARDPVLSLVSHGPDLWAMTHAGLFQSRDSGRSWSAQRPPAFPRDASLRLSGHGRKLFSAGGCLFAGAQTGLFRNCGTGGAWSRIEGPPDLTRFRRLQGDEDLMVAGESEAERPWYSLDQGRTWNKAPGFMPGENSVSALFQDGRRLWVSGMDLTSSEDGGRTWQARGQGGVTLMVRALDRLWVGDPWSRLESSPDSGITWDEAALPEPVPAQYLQPTSLVEIDSLLFISGTLDHCLCGGVFMSPDTGRTWMPRNTGFSTFLVGRDTAADANQVLVLGRTLVAMTSKGPFRSTDLGVSWSPANRGLPASQELLLTTHEGILYAEATGSTRGGWFISRDTARSWILWNPGVPDAQRLHFSSRAAFVVRAIPDSGIPDPVYFSTDGMTTWQRLRGSWEADGNVGLGEFFVTRDYAILSMSSVARLQHWFSEDGGVSWRADSVSLLADRLRLRADAGGLQFRTNLATLLGSGDSGVTWRAYFTDAADIEAVASNGNLAVLANGDLFASTDTARSWYPAKFGPDRPARMYDLALHAGRFFAGTSRGLWTSTNGLDWRPAQEVGLSTWGLRALAVSGDNLVAATNRQVYHSQDGGATWRSPAGLPASQPDSPPIHWVHAHAGRFFAGHMAAGLWASADSGKTWTKKIGAGLRTDVFLRGMGSGPQGVYAVTTWNRILLSRDAGETWSDWGAAPSQAMEPIQVAGAEGGLYSLLAEGGYSSEAGAWSQAALPGPAPHDFLAGSTGTLAGILAVTSGDGIFVRPDRNSEWAAVAGGLPESEWTALALDGNRLYAGLFTQGLWRNASLPSPIRKAVSERVGKLSIHPGSGGRKVFRLFLPRPSRVRLSLHDAAGKIAGSLHESLPGGPQDLSVEVRGTSPVYYRLEIRAGEGEASPETRQGRLPPD